MITFILVVTCIVCCCCCALSCESEPDNYAEATPVKPVHTSYDSVGTSSGGNLGAAALGAVAGFVAGTALEASRSGRSGGGYDIAGDSGGGYNIQGDSGSYDISGDS